MPPLLTKLRLRFPQLQYTAGRQFCWSPETQEIFYKPSGLLGTKNDAQTDAWSLLHETGHALLAHSSYEADVELVRLEVAAWEEARQLGELLHVPIAEDHIQDCLDTYRDWLYKRSICPSCRTKCLQQDDHAHYRCFNCHTVWRVGTSRFCRAYRTTKNVNQFNPVFDLQNLS